MKKQLILSVCILLFLLIGTILLIFYGEGYRLDFSNNHKIVAGTGLLVATSLPDGAQVQINGHLTTATNNTLNLSPGTYDVKISKDGYFPWEKTIVIQNEVVSKAEATLFPTAPGLQSITAMGVASPTIDPSGTRLAYTVSSQSGALNIKNGIYVLNMAANSFLPLQNGASQIVNDNIDKFSSSSLLWSPDGQNLLATISASSTTYLLNATSFNDSPKDVTETLSSVQATWNKEKADADKAQIAQLPVILKTIITKDFSVIGWSDDQTKILYVASQSATIPQIIKPTRIGSDSTPQQRTIEPGNVYVYDIKEDQNFQILNPQNKQLGVDFYVRWMPDARHLVYVHDMRVDIIEYDGLNKTTVYAGPFTDGYVYPWPDGSKIVIMTNLNNPDIAPNLYTVSLK